MKPDRAIDRIEAMLSDGAPLPLRLHELEAMRDRLALVDRCALAVRMTPDDEHARRLTREACARAGVVLSDDPSQWAGEVKAARIAANQRAHDALDAAERAQSNATN